MRKITFVRVMLLVLLLSWMTLIFLFSAQEAVASSELSGDFIYNILTAFVSKFKNLNSEERMQMVELLQFFVRKAAHATIYFVLGVLSAGFLNCFGFKSKRICAAFAELVCVLYAVSDEIHQTFVEGRSGQASDVILDSIGSALGIAALCFVIFLTVRKWHSRSRFN